MIASFEVGAVFKIINEASPALAQILKQVREINSLITKAKENMATFGAMKMPTGMAAAIGETDALAASWKSVAANARVARNAIGNAARASAGAGYGAGSGSGAAASAGGGRSMLGGRLGMGGRGGGGAHFNGPNIGVPGGSHVRLGGPMAVAAGVAGYAAYQAMQYDDAVVLMANHAGVDLKENRAKFRAMLEDATKATGYSEHDVSLASQQELRMFADTGGSNGVDVLPKMLRYAATEARLKGTSLEESMTALTGLAHMVQKYNEKDVDKIVPAFSALSLRSPMTLSAQERAFGYAVPLLHSAMELDPLEVMAASTGLARAGISSTKAGTWIREMMVNSMPGTSLMSKMRYKKHEAALKEMGLVDKNDKPTWFVDGKPNMMKFLEKTQENFPKIPIARRAAVATALEGKQGAGALAVLSEPAVREQVQRMYSEAKDPANVNRMRNFMTEYDRDSSLQNARTTVQTFNVLMADLGDKTLPAVNLALGDFKAVLEGIRNLLPGGQGGATVGGRALEGAAAGALLGSVVPGVGTLIGAAGGGVLGAAEGFMEQYSKGQGAKQDKATTDEFLNALRRQGEGGAVKPPVWPPISLTVKMDSQTIGQAVAKSMSDAYTFTQSAPAADGMESFSGGDHHQMDH